MNGEYLQEWAELRRLRRRVLGIVLAGVSVYVLLTVSLLAPRTVAKLLGLGLFAAWVALLIAFFWAGLSYVYWSCPRCGKAFHYKSFFLGRWSNPFARRCLHCSLPKWADSDPDPTLKHELDPFRTDPILKLGDS